MPDSLEEMFDTSAAHDRAVGTVLSVAKREICIFDADIATLGLETRVRADAIAAFLARGRDRSLRIVLHDLEHVNRYSPRLMGLLRRYSHCFAIRQTPESLRNLADAFVLADGITGVVRFHADHFRGKLFLERPLEVHDWQQRFENLWLESIPGISASHLGL
jgi:hypothetical protein